MIYAVISFGFGLGWVHTHEGRMQLIGIIIGQYLLKACLALLDTPFSISSQEMQTAADGIV